MVGVSEIWSPMAGDWGAVSWSHHDAILLGSKHYDHHHPFFLTSLWQWLLHALNWMALIKHSFDLWPVCWLHTCRLLISKSNYLLWCLLCYFTCSSLHRFPHNAFMSTWIPSLSSFNHVHYRLQSTMDFINLCLSNWSLFRQHHN